MFFWGAGFEWINTAIPIDAVPRAPRREQRTIGRNKVKPNPHPDMAAYFFASPVDVDIHVDGEDKRKQVELKLEKERRESCPVYYDGESVVGQVKLPPLSPVLSLGRLYTLYVMLMELLYALAMLN